MLRHPIAHIAFGAVFGALVTALIFLGQKPDAHDEPQTDDGAGEEETTEEQETGEAIPPEVFGRDISGACDFRGVVTAPDGTPIADAMVRLRLGDEPWAAPLPPHQEETDDQGRFRMSDLNGSLPFVFWAYKPGHAVAGVQVTGCDEEIALVLEPGGALTVAIAGEARGMLHLQIAGGALWPPRVARISADEPVTIDGLEPGEYALSLWTAKQSYFSAELVSVAADEIRKVEVALSPSKASEIHVRTADGAPVPGARMIIHPLEQPLLKQVLTADERGAVSYRGQSGARFAAVISHPGMVDGKITFSSGAPVSVDLEAGISVSGFVRTKEGRAIPDATLEVVQEVGGGLIPFRASMGQDFHRGLITAAADGWPRLAPLAEGRLIPGPMKLPLPMPGTDRQAGGPLPWHPTDEYGRFALDGLSTGRVTLTASHTEYVMARPAVLTLESGKTIVDALVYMKKGQEILLRVVDKDGFPIPEAEVAVFDFDSQLIQSGTTAPDGYAELKGLPRSVRIEVSREGYVSRFTQHHGKTGEAVDLVVKLPPADRHLRGRVKDSRGFGVGGVAIVARAKGKGLLQVLTGVTEGDGIFDIAGAGDGIYHVTADGADKGGAQVLDADHRSEIKMSLDLSKRSSGPILPASPSAFSPAVSGGMASSPDNLGVVGEAFGNPSPSDLGAGTDEAEPSIHTQFGMADDLPVTGPPSGKGGLPITLSGGAGKVTVTRVAPGSRIEAAGLTKGCRIISVDGNPVNGPADARRALEGAIGSVVMLEVMENDETFTIVVQRERVSQ